MRAALRSQNGRFALRFVHDQPTTADARTVAHTARDLDREHEFLSVAAPGRPAYLDAAIDRLEAGGTIYGDRWSRVGVRQLLGELVEEAVDLAAWAALAEQLLDVEPGLSDLHADQIRAVLALAARRGAQAHDLLAQVIRSLPARDDR